VGSSCPCLCHLNKFNLCDINGGCGSNHRSSPGACVTCPIVRPDSDPRQPHQPPVCDGDRRLLHRWLGEIANLIADLTNPEEPIINRRLYERFGVEYLEDGQRRTVSLGQAWADPVSALGGVSPINSRSTQPSVSGSRERPLPINAALLDLKAPGRTVNPTAAVADWPEDQIGYLSAATVLDEWIRAVRSELFPDHHLPPATVDEMVAWLRTPTGDERTRVDDICDRYGQVPDFAASIKHLRGALRAAAGETEPQPQRCEQVPCRSCDMEMLYRQPGGDVHCVNPDCRAVLREAEYQDWVRTVAAAARIKQAQHATAGRG
jgi:hypothetical protein